MLENAMFFASFFRFCNIFTLETQQILQNAVDFDPKAGFLKRGTG